jgi:hypothetical protein
MTEFEYVGEKLACCFAFSLPNNFNVLVSAGEVVCSVEIG